MKISVILLATFASVVTGFPNGLLGKPRSGNANSLGVGPPHKGPQWGAKHVAPSVAVPVALRGKRSASDSNAAATAANNVIHANGHKGGEQYAETNSIATVLSENKGHGHSNSGSQAAAMAQSATLLENKDGYSGGYERGPEGRGTSITTITNTIASSGRQHGYGGYGDSREANALSSAQVNSHGPIQSSISSLSEAVVSGQNNGHGLSQSVAMSAAQADIASHYRPPMKENPAPQRYLRPAPRPVAPPASYSEPKPIEYRPERPLSGSVDTKLLRGLLILPWSQRIPKQANFIPLTRVYGDDEDDESILESRFNRFSDVITARLANSFKRNPYRSYSDFFGNANAEANVKQGGSGKGSSITKTNSLIHDNDGFGGWANSNSFAQSMNDNGIASALSNSLSGSDGYGSSSASAAAAAAASAKNGIATASASTAAATALADAFGHQFGSGISNGISSGYGHDSESGANANTNVGSGKGAGAGTSAGASAGGVSASAGSDSGVINREPSGYRGWEYLPYGRHKRHISDFIMSGFSNAGANTQISGKGKGTANSNTNNKIVGQGGHYGYPGSMSMQALSNSAASVNAGYDDIYGQKYGLHNGLANSQTNSLVKADFNDKSNSISSIANSVANVFGNGGSGAASSASSVSMSSHIGKDGKRVTSGSGSAAGAGSAVHGGNQANSNSITTGNFLARHERDVADVSAISNANSQVAADGLGDVTGSAVTNTQVTEKISEGVKGATVDAGANAISQSNVGASKGGEQIAANTATNANTLVQSHNDGKELELNGMSNAMSTMNIADKDGKSAGAGSSAASSAVATKVDKDGSVISSASSASSASISSSNAGHGGSIISSANSGAALNLNSRLDHSGEEAFPDFKSDENNDEYYDDYYNNSEYSRWRRSIGYDLGLTGNANVQTNQKNGQGNGYANSQQLGKVTEDEYGGINVEGISNSIAALNMDGKYGKGPWGSNGVAEANSIVSMKQNGGGHGAGMNLLANGLSSAKVTGNGGAATASSSSSVSSNFGKGQHGSSTVQSTSTASIGLSGGHKSGSTVANSATVLNAKPGKKHKREAPEPFSSLLGQATSSAGVNGDFGLGQLSSIANSVANVLVNNENGHKGGPMANIAANSQATTSFKSEGNKGHGGDFIANAVSQAAANFLGRRKRDLDHNDGLSSAIGQASSTAEVQGSNLNGNIVASAQAVSNVASMNNHGGSGSNIQAFSNSVASVESHGSPHGEYDGHNPSSIIANVAANSNVMNEIIS